MLRNAHPAKTARYEVSSERLSQRCRRRGRAAAKAPSDPAPSSTTLYQDKVQVLKVCGTSPGMMACSRENAAERSVPVPFNIPRSEEHTSELQSHHDLVCR